MSPSLPERSGSARTGILHKARGETPEEARIAVLHLARTAAERGEVCLFASTAAPSALADLADRIGFDLADAARRGSFQLLRTPAALLGDGLSDEARARTVADLAALVCERQPALFALDDLDTLDRFEAPGAFEAALDALHAELAARAIPLVLATVEAPPPRRLAASRAPVRSNVPPPPPPADLTAEVHGDGTALPNSGIEYLDLKVSPPKLPAVDPFAASGSATRPLRRAHFVSSEMDAAPPRHYDPPAPHAAAHRTTTADALLETDLFEHAGVVSTLDVFDTEPAATPDAVAPSPRRVFTEALAEAMAAHEATAQPFLVVALRMSPADPSAPRFHLVLSALEHALGEGAVLLGVAERCRAVWLMPGATPEAAAPVFAALKRFLRDATPDADLLVRSTSAALIPNGAAFSSAETLLAELFDSES